MLNYLLNKKLLIIFEVSVGYSVDVREYVITKETGTKSKKNINLLDDVYTTGATIHLAAKALTEMGVEEVESLTLFR